MIFSNRSDSLGAFSSGMCLIHCISTPFIFALQPLALADEAAPSWWKSLDYIFLAISFLAVYWSANNTPKRWLQYALWICWAALTFAILDEKMELFHLGEISVYFPALGLIGLHLYNRKYCQCAGEDCCANL